MANFGLCSALCLAGICACGKSYAQIYSVRPDTVKIWKSHKQNDPLDPGRVTFYAGPVVSVQPLLDADGFRVLTAMYGVAAGARVNALRSFSFGAEVQYFPPGNVNVPLLDYFSQCTLYAVARWNLTPDTLPSLFLETGAGRTQSSFKLKRRRGRGKNFSSSVFFVGGGSRMWLGKGWALELSARMLYLQKTGLNHFLQYESRAAFQSALVLSLRF